MTQIYMTLLMATGFLGACAHDQCNNVPQRPPASVANAAEAPQPPQQTSAPVSLPQDPVLISKPTGEKQCANKPDTQTETIDKVQASLVSKKIKVYESHVQSDGKMHMELCGAPSGSINVFTISKKDLKKAEKLGFKVFTPKP